MCGSIIIVLIGNSLTANDVECLLKCSLAICIFSLISCLFISQAHFLMASFVYLLNFLSFLHILGTSSLPNRYFENVFLVCSLSFHLCNTVIHRAEVLIYRSQTYQFFSVTDHFLVLSKNLWPNPRSPSFYFIFQELYHFTFWSMIHFELIFENSVRLMSRFFFSFSVCLGMGYTYRW